MIFVYEKRRIAIRLSNGTFKKFLRNEVLFKFIKNKAERSNRKSKNLKKQGANAGIYHRAWKYKKLIIIDLFIKKWQNNHTIITTYILKDIVNNTIATKSCLKINLKKRKNKKRRKILCLKAVL